MIILRSDKIKIEEAKRLKDELQETIKGLITGFEQQTGLEVKSVDVVKTRTDFSTLTTPFPVLGDTHVLVTTEGL